MSAVDFKRRQVSGRGIPVAGNDIDTDRIIPARFLKAVTVDVEKQEVRFADRVIKATVPDGPRNQLVGGTWDSTAVLLEAGATIEATAGKLPYVKGW